MIIHASPVRTYPRKRFGIVDSVYGGTIKVELRQAIGCNRLTKESDSFFFNVYVYVYGICLRNLFNLHIIGQSLIVES